MISMKLMAGMGNQMFQYATARAIQLENKDSKTYLVLDRMSNKSHNVYALNHFNISRDLKVVKHKYNLKNCINEFAFRYYNIVLSKNINTAVKNLQNINNKINKFGCALVLGDYIKINLKNNKSKYLYGYFQSYKYFDKYEDVIKKELKVNEKISSKHKK